MDFVDLICDKKRLDHSFPPSCLFPVLIPVMEVSFQVSDVGNLVFLFAALLVFFIESLEEFLG